MLGWLKRKPAPVPSEPARKSEDEIAAGEVRLERLLGRLGSDAGAASEQTGATVLEPPRPRPEPTPALRAPPPAAERPINQRPVNQRPVAEDPAEAVLKEIYPGAPAAKPPAEDPEEALLKELYPATPAAAPVAAAPAAAAEPPSDPVAAEKSALETAAVLADIERIVAGDATTEEPDEEPAAAEALQTEPVSDEAPGELAAAVAEPASDPVPEPVPVKIEMPPVDLAEEALAEAAEEVAPLARAEPKTARRRGGKRPAEVEAPAGGGEARPPVDGRGGFPPMFVIAVASQKGGAGKTTLAAHLAVRAGIAGQGPVVLIDTDPQGSLAEWWHARSDETPALAVVKPEQLGANLAELRSYGTAVAVIDTPPALTGSIEQVIQMADLIIIPVRPSPHDLRAAGGTVQMAQRAGKPFMFVVNGASPRASITAQAVAALSEHGRVAPVILYQRTEYAASMIDGRTVVEAAPSGRSAQEIAELWQCIFAQVGMRAAA